MAISLNPSVCLGDQLEVGNLLVIARAQARGLGLRLKCMEKCLKVCSVMNLRPHLLCNCNRHLAEKELAPIETHIQPFTGWNALPLCQ